MKTIIKFLKRLSIAFAFMVFILFLWGRSISFENRFAPVLYAQNGEILSASVSEDQQWRIKCNEDLPIKLKTAIRLFEDEYFYNHLGVNPASMFKAVMLNLKAGKIKRGGSTLTMQLARLYYKNRKRTYLQKIKEVLLAVAIELNYSKEFILSKYCQYAPFGGNIVGYCSASYKYYGKAPDNLSWSEATTLAVLPNAPSDVFPGKSQERLIKKKTYLLEKLLHGNFIDSVTFRLSILENVPQESLIFKNRTPHLLASQKKKGKRGNIYSTIDFSLQNNLLNTVDNYFNQNVTEGVDNLSVLVIRNNGEVAAVVSNTTCKSKDCSYDVNMINAFRSPGSVMKPFLYGVALDKGLISPHSLLLDVPTFYNGFSPKNFDKTFKGIVSAKQALTLSLNIPAVNLLSKYGTSVFIDDLNKMGYKNTNKDAGHYGLSLILGGNEVSMVEVGKSYMNLMRTALGKKPKSLKFVEEENVKTIGIQNDFPMSRGASYLVLDMLTGVNRPESEDGWQFFTNNQKVSWKTGTSYGYRDAWSVGVTKDYTVVVWVGNADGEGKKGLTGIQKAAPVLFSVFDLLPQSEEISFPYRSFKHHRICKTSGYSATEACIEVEDEYLPLNSHNLALCQFDKVVMVDTTESFRLNNSCAINYKGHQKSYFVLNPIVNNYYKKATGIDCSIPPLKEGCNEETNDLDIIYPTNNALILIPKDVNTIQQELICTATTANFESLFWFLNNKYLGETSEQHKVKFIADVGKHLITIVAKSGETVSHKFELIN